MAETLRTSDFVYQEQPWSENLLIQLNVLRESDVLCDITVFIDGHSFRCHRLVLAAACPYFEALFRHDLESRTKTELSLGGVSVIGFKNLLEFMYTSRIQISSEHLIEILEAADFLQYRNIVNVCCDMLLQHITDENALSLHHLAVAHLCQPLAEATHEYILTNFSNIAMMQDFKLLTMETMKHFLNSYKTFLHPNGIQFSCLQFIYNSVLEWASKFDMNVHDTLFKLDWDPFHIASTIHQKEIMLNESDYAAHDNMDFIELEDRYRHFEVLVVVPREVCGKSKSANIVYYHPHRQRWLILTELPFTNRTFYSVNSLDNVLYLCGGEKKQDMPTRKVFVYEIESNKWLSQVESMIQPRSNHSTTTSRGMLYVFGGRGCSKNNFWNDGEVYNPQTRQWTLLPSIPGVLGLARCCLLPLGGQLYIFGGMESYTIDKTKGNRPFRGAYRYHLERKQWVQCPELAARLEENNISIGLGDCLAWKGFILIIDEDKRCKKMKLYNPVTGEMAQFLNTHGQHRFGGYALMNNMLYCTGGMYETFGCHDLVHCIDLLEPVDWQFVSPLPSCLSHHTCLILSKVLDLRN